MDKRWRNSSFGEKHYFFLPQTEGWEKRAISNPEQRMRCCKRSLRCPNNRTAAPLPSHVQSKIFSVLSFITSLQSFFFNSIYLVETSDIWDIWLDQRHGEQTDQIEPDPARFFKRLKHDIDSFGRNVFHGLGVSCCLLFFYLLFTLLKTSLDWFNMERRGESYPRISRH